ncbi:sulfotransferase family protein [Hyphomonas sp. NPDC076900]|uniref:sulfotransferase family protein n=1 Tax=unclassified Hyphomonas TaxID=2630699 RepID=UPI003D02F7E2
MTRRIDFMIAGVQKGGTTSLDAFLRQHPHISMARKKEPHFFDKPPPTGLRPLDHALYHMCFDWRAAGQGARLGEATPALTWWEGAMTRVWRYNSKIRIIMILRDPVERAWSHYRMDVRLGRETACFSEAIRAERERARRALPLQDRERSYVSRGYYANQIRQLRRLFPENQLLFLRSEMLSQDPQAILSRVCDFLDVAPFTFAAEKRHNSAPEAASLADIDRDYLCALYQHDAEETRHLLGWDKDGWSV